MAVRASNMRRWRGSQPRCQKSEEVHYGSESSFGGLTLQEHHYFQRASLQVARRAATAGCGTKVRP